MKYKKDKIEAILKPYCGEDAGKVSLEILSSLLPPQMKSIYDVLTEEPQPVAEIAEHCKVESRAISAHLCRYAEESDLVGFILEKNKKLWFRLK